LSPLSTAKFSNLSWSKGSPVALTTPPPDVHIHISPLDFLNIYWRSLPPIPVVCELPLKALNVFLRSYTNKPDVVAIQIFPFLSVWRFLILSKLTPGYSSFRNG